MEFFTGLATRFAFNIILMMVFKQHNMAKVTPPWLVSLIAGAWFMVDYDKATGVMSMDTTPTSMLMLGFISFDFIVALFEKRVKK
jgi:hypothetical protein